MVKHRDGTTRHTYPKKPYATLYNDEITVDVFRCVKGHPAIPGKRCPAMQSEAYVKNS